jgi:hypothetical protein
MVTLRPVPSGDGDIRARSMLEVSARRRVVIGSAVQSIPVPNAPDSP